MEVFQSTHPSRGATATETTVHVVGKFQSTHPSRGATVFCRLFVLRLRVSIHAPLAGCDSSTVRGRPYFHGFNPRTPRGVRPDAVQDARRDAVFQSTHPSRGATVRCARVRRPADVSIHAPLAGCDLRAYTDGYRKEVFQSTHPSRGATERVTDMLLWCMFQSTHPSRGATTISIRETAQVLFQSTHPSRGATPTTMRSTEARMFQSTHPSRGATPSST